MTKTRMLLGLALLALAAVLPACASRNAQQVPESEEWMHQGPS